MTKQESNQKLRTFLFWKKYRLLFWYCKTISHINRQSFNSMENLGLMFKNSKLLFYSTWVVLAQFIFLLSTYSYLQFNTVCKSECLNGEYLSCSQLWYNIGRTRSSPPTQSLSLFSFSFSHSLFLFLSLPPSLFISLSIFQIQIPYISASLSAKMFLFAFDFYSFFGPSHKRTTFSLKFILLIYFYFS
jgi:hypothetical protein